MKRKYIFFLFSILLGSGIFAQQKENIPTLYNPISVQYIKKNIKKTQPRLVLNSSIEKMVKKKVQSDPIIKNYYTAIKLNSEKIMQEPFLERIMTGRRLLSVSREMLYRVNMLGMVYRIEKDQEALKRLNNELLAVCNFTDWNPSHYLDVAEMAMAVALAIDWAGDGLPELTIKQAKKALIEKGIKPSWPSDGKKPGWAYGTNNWNQVCNGGMIAASIVIADEEPDLAAKTIKRALDGIPNALSAYLPDGIYPEGSTYWGYGTGFSTITCAMLESAFGTNFGHTEHEAFMKSAMFRVMCNAPSGWYYNYADCGDRRGVDADVILAWFASKTGNKVFFESDRLMRDPNKMNKLSRLGGAALVWLAQYKEKPGIEIPSVWSGKGDNPIVIFTGKNGYYFGGKGGRATISHGNMDAGSFIFELDGVRWVTDPGNQDYHTLEKTGFNLWSNCQDCERWTLLTKNNYGHSTLTVNKTLHKAKGQATLIEVKDDIHPKAVFNMTDIFDGALKEAKRTFSKEGETSLLITDDIEISSETKQITWQLITTSDIELTEWGAILRQNGKSLKLENLSHSEFQLSVVSLFPAPLALDRQIKGLKRIELRIPAWTIKDGKTNIKIRLKK